MLEVIMKFVTALMVGLVFAIIIAVQGGPDWAVTATYLFGFLATIIGIDVLDLKDAD